jgi:Na+-driven multidrug efflux pump
MISIASIIGLFLNIIGVVILYFFGPPIPTILPDGTEVLSYGEDAEKGKKANIAKRNIRISRFALAIIIVGFVLQLVGQFTYKGYHQPDRNNYTNTSNNEIKVLEPKSPVK